MLNEIKKLFERKLIEARKRVFDKKVVFVSTINNEGV